MIWPKLFMCGFVGLNGLVSLSDVKTLLVIISNY